MIAFTKMHGLANDYIYVDCFREKLSGIDIPDLCRRMSDRHTGVGSDGLILITPPQAGVAADARMEMYNADGSRGEMCGNGIRCVAKYVLDHGVVVRCGASDSPARSSHDIRIQTDRGVLTLTAHFDGDKVSRVRVNMGSPIFRPADVPVRLTASPGSLEGQPWTTAGDRGFPADQEAPIVRAELPVAGGWPPNLVRHPLRVTCVSMGNPHAVTFLDGLGERRSSGASDPNVASLRNFDLPRIGPLVERHPIFPNRVNFHIVQVHSPTEATMRTWERGSGITQACGTGACAVVVAGILEKRLDRRVLVHLPGGDLEIEWPEANPQRPGPVFMTGPAVEVFSGQWPS